MGHPSLLSKEAGRYNGRRNADKLIPGEVLPPCVETESRFLIKNGVLMQHLGHEEEVTIPDTCTALEQIELTKGLKKSGGTRFPKRLSPISICPTSDRYGIEFVGRRVRDSRGGQKSGG